MRFQITLTEEPPMTTRRRLGDRRNRVRYEIVGQLWGSLETFEPMEVHNLSRGGALVETRVPLTTDSVQRLRFASPGHTLDLQARVAHVSQRQDVTAPENFLVGLQFIGLPPQAGDYIDGVVAANLGDPSPAPARDGEA
jgi:hypothetical protein